jgi:AraC-like DNA-binding protein
VGAREAVAGHTASAIALRPILAYATKCGVDAASLLLDIGISANALDDPDHRISEATHERAWREAAVRSHDPVFGLHVALHADVGAYDVLDYSLHYSETVMDAFCRMSRFHRLICDSLATTVSSTRSIARVLRTYPAHTPDAADCFFGVLVRRARELAGPDLRVREVRFMHDPPRDPAPYAAHFRCPVSFGRATSELLFYPEDFTRKIRSPTPGLVDVLDRQMRELLSRLPAGDTNVERVRHAVGSTLKMSARPSLQSTSRALKASPRTVQRWLAENGTSHREVVDGVRREVAQRLLGVRRMSITEVAFLTGFADEGSFRRTFKRWTGETPSSFRAHAA